MIRCLFAPMQAKPRCTPSIAPRGRSCVWITLVSVMFVLCAFVGAGLLYAGFSPFSGSVRIAEQQTEQAEPTSDHALLASEQASKSDQRAAYGRPHIVQRARKLNGGGRVLAIHSTAGGYHVRVLKHGDIRTVVVP